MPSLKPEIAQKTGREYWRSLEEYARTAEFAQMVQRDFPSVAPEAMSEATRRDFLKLMGASLAMAGLTGCSWPEERILPFTNRPEGRLPGVPVYYATVMELAGVARGLLVKSFDGRPIKVEGNPQHPESQGASDLLSQASILDLYDPDRQQTIEERLSGATYPRTWGDFETWLRPVMTNHRAAGGRGLGILAESSSSPSLARMRARLLTELPSARWTEWEPVSHDVVREATASVFGRPMRLHPAFDRAEVILSLDHDFLVSDPVSVRYAFDWAEGRQIQNGRMSRLYVAESLFSPTGGVADHRLALPPSEIPGFAAEVAAALLGSGVTSPALNATSLRAAGQSGKNAAFAKQVAADLAAHRGRCLVVAGPRQPSSVHVLALALNEALGNIGATLQVTADPDPERPSHATAIRDLAASLGNGEIETLVILGGNPVFDAPGDLAFADRLGRAGRTVHLTLHPNETSARCNWVIPRAHYLESWGDARAHEGTISVMQPLIRPLYDGRTPLEMVAALLEDRRSGYEIVRETYAQLGTGEEFERRWREILHEGLVPGTSLPAETVSIDPGRALTAIDALAPAGGAELEVVFQPDPCIYDGRFANNGWLQELPEFLTKVTWDNVAQVSPSTANQLAISSGDVIRIEKDGRSIEVAACITPGVAPRSIVLSLGYGRTVCGRVGTGTGFDVYPLRASDSLHQLAGVAVTKTGRGYSLSSTQDHFPLDATGAAGTEHRLQELVRQASLTEMLGGGAAPGGGVHGATGGVHSAPEHGAAMTGTHGEVDAAGHAAHPPVIPLWDEHTYEAYKWGMAIDLTACTGCNACVIACQSENNIPVVGKDQVKRNREMHWIRIDRYFSGTPDDPLLVLQPVTCHHCENAPCEQVCPVAATTHSHEGLNDMTYNRCIGTRYCQNNCPYKVRRFNFFAYNHELTMTERMGKNPDVTVRGRGVMEKCSFCVQRITEVRIAAKNEKRPIRDGEITPACAQACPTRAITFGDLNDPNSRVRKLHDHPRAYGMLDAELYTKPRLHYLTRVRNPHPALVSVPGGGDGEHHG